MKIVIIGSGEIGYDLASVLSKEKHDVTILDRDKDCLTKSSETLDVLTVEGNATSANDLVRAGVKVFRVPVDAPKGRLMFDKESLDNYMADCRVLPRP